MLRKLLNKKNKTGLYFSASSLMLSFVNTICSLLTISWLLPSEIGLWNSIIVVQSYVFIAQLGVFNGLNREIPYYYGKGELQKVNDYASTALWLSRLLIISSFILNIVVFVYMFLSNNYEDNVIISVLIIGFIASNQFYDNYLIVTFRSSSSFLKLAKIYLIQSFIIGASLSFVYFWGYKGFVFRALFISVSQIFLTHINRPLNVKAKFNKQIYFDLIKVGFPIFILGYLISITNTFSRIILLNVDGVISVGLFAPALAVITTVKLFPNIVSQYVYPKMTYSWGMYHDKKIIWGWVWKSALYLFVLFIPIVIVGWYLIPIIIENLFPKYIESVFAARIALLSCLTSGVAIGLNSLNAIKAYYSMLIITIIKVVSFWVFIHYFTVTLKPLDGAAIGFLIADFFTSLVAMVFLYYNFCTDKNIVKIFKK